MSKFNKWTLSCITVAIISPFIMRYNLEITDDRVTDHWSAIFVTPHYLFFWIYTIIRSIYGVYILIFEVYKKTRKGLNE